MKKILSMIVSLTMLMSQFAIIGAKAEEATEETPANKTKVVWIGGSYAAGAGSEQKTDALPTGVSAQPFAKTVTDYLGTVYDNGVDYYNVAIGGTPSTYGRNRYEKDVLLKDPDIVFVEFTGNDDYLVTDTEKVSLALEGMVRATQTYEKLHNKQIKMVFVYRPWFSNNGSYNENRDVIGAYHAIAEYYGIYELDGAEEAKKLWEEDGVEYSSMISADGGHPTALGHYYTGKAMVNILKKNPITNDKFRSLPMNVNYTEISPINYEASTALFLDAENTTFTKDGDNMVSETAGDKLTYKFKGTSVGVVLENVSAKVTVTVDGKQLTNFSAGSAQALANAQDLSDGEHTLVIENTGGGKVTIKEVFFDGVANASVIKQDNYSWNVYEDTCKSTDALEGRSLNGAYIVNPANVGNYSGLYSENAIGFYAHVIGAKVATYQLSGISGWSEDSNITNVNLRYIEYIKNGQKYADKNIVIKAIDKDGNVLKTFDKSDCSYEMQSSATGLAWRIFDLKVYNVPENATGIQMWLYNNNNTILTNLKICYTTLKTDGIILDMENAWVTLNDTADVTLKQYKNNGEESDLPDGAEVTYTSSNEDIATIGENGTISGKAEGKTVITATAVIDGETFMAKKTVAVRDIKDYTDTAAKAIPANLINNAWAIDGQASREITRTTAVDNSYEQYTANADNPKENIYTFHGNLIYAKNALNSDGESLGKYLNLDGFKAGKTYVYQASVKNMNENYTPYYGIAHPNNQGGNDNNIGSNIYGKTGMAVTSTDYTLFRDTLTYPETYDSTTTSSWNGQNIYQGLRVANTQAGASVAVKKALANVTSAETLAEGGLYLAEEQATSLSVTADKTELAMRNGKVTLTAKVLNQIQLEGKLDQTVTWVALNEDRSEFADTLSVTADGNTASVKVKDGVEAGKYVIVAATEKYGMVKGIEIEVTDTTDYSDTEIAKIPENLIKNGLAIDGCSSTQIDRNDKVQGEEQYTVKEVLTNGGNYTFHGSGIAAKNETKAYQTSVGHTDVIFEAGKTYVYQASVKNLNSEYTPYYGIAHPNNSGGNNSIGSNTYGKTGMAVTSTDWTLFRDTLTYPDTYDNTKMDWAGQVIWQGVRVNNTVVGASLAVKKAAADATSAETLKQGGLYLAEEKATRLDVTAKNNNPTLALGGKLKLTAQVLNQLDICGTLDQTVTWVALNEDRTAVENKITITQDGNTAILKTQNGLAEGKYTIVAMSEKYEMVKGITITVKEDFALKYTEFEQPEMPKNYIEENYKSSVMLSSNWGKVTQGSLETIDGKNAKKLTATGATTGYDVWKVFSGTALRAKKSIGQSGANEAWVNFNAFVPGKSYVFATKVKNATENSEITPYVGNNVFTKWNYAPDAAKGSEEYGKTGMAVTSTEWTDYKSTIKYDPNHTTQNNPDLGSVMYWGLATSSTEGAAVYYSTDDLYLAEEVPYTFENTLVSGNATIENEGSLKLTANLYNQLGLPGTLSQEFEWAALTADRTAMAKGITLTVSEDTKSCEVNVSAETAEGKYVIAAYSDEQAVAKGFEITVNKKKSATADIKIAEEEGIAYFEKASVENAECDKVMFIMAAYSKDASGNLTLIKVLTDEQTVSNGTASSEIEYFMFDDENVFESGTVIKAFCWESGSQKPIELTAESEAEIAVAE